MAKKNLDYRIVQLNICLLSKYTIDIEKGKRLLIKIEQRFLNHNLIINSFDILENGCLTHETLDAYKFWKLVFASIAHILWTWLISLKCKMKVDLRAINRICFKFFFAYFQLIKCTVEICKNKFWALWQMAQSFNYKNLKFGFNFYIKNSFRMLRHECKTKRIVQQEK